MMHGNTLKSSTKPKSSEKGGDASGRYAMKYEGTLKLILTSLMVGAFPPQIAFATGSSIFLFFRSIDKFLQVLSQAHYRDGDVTSRKGMILLETVSTHFSETLKLKA